MDEKQLQIKPLLSILCENDVKFIVVGGVCAVFNGATMTTFDLDIVHSRTPENIEHLMKALESLDTNYKDLAGRRLKPSKTTLAGPGQHLLMTRFGSLDVLGTIGSGLDYDKLSSQTVEVQVGLKRPIRILNLETLIRTKEEAGRDKDIAALPLLRRTLAVRSNTHKPSPGKE
jgi:hypothetical protein